MKQRRLAIRFISLFVLVLNFASFTNTSHAAPALDPVKSTVVANPTTVPADGTSATWITVNAVGVNNKPITITSVSLIASPSTGLLYAISASSNPPSTPGQVVFVVLSTVPEQVTFTAVINGVTLPQQAVVTFMPALIH